jgi:hypothetical protein
MPTVAIVDTVTSVSADTLRLIGTFTDQATFKQPFDIQMQGVTTAEQVRARLATSLEASQAQDTLKKLIVPGEYDLTPPPPPPPTEQQIFLQLWGQYQSALRKVTAGLVDSAAKEVEDLRVQVVAAYKPEFVGVG